MCTASWIRADDGYELFFNRDERRERRPELPARELEVGGLRVLAPADGDFGGSWLAVNEHGLALFLMNAYVPRRGAPAAGAPGARSRGLLVLELAGARAPDELAGRLERAELGAYEPFWLGALAPGAPAALWSWDGASLAAGREVEGQVPLASSGFDQERARAERRARFAALEEAAGRRDAALLAAFHADHGAAGAPGPYTTCMHRPDARTRSLCRVRVGRERVQLAHHLGPPCELAEERELSIPRARPRRAG